MKRLIILSAFFLLTACDGEPRPAVLYCPECEATGETARIWREAQLNTVECRAPWNDRVEILRTRGEVALIRTSSTCVGWVSVVLLQQ